jgi:hypothetical protein
MRTRWVDYLFCQVFYRLYFRFYSKYANILWRYQQWSKSTSQVEKNLQFVATFTVNTMISWIYSSWTDCRAKTIHMYESYWSFWCIFIHFSCSMVISSIEAHFRSKQYSQCLASNCYIRNISICREVTILPVLTIFEFLQVITRATWWIRCTDSKVCNFAEYVRMVIKCF